MRVYLASNFMMKKIALIVFTCWCTVAVAQDPQIVSILDDVSIDSLIYHSSAISGEFPVIVNGNSETISSRNKNNPGNAIAAQYIKERLEAYGLDTEVQTFGAVGENVLATQPGLLFPNQKVIICGHYDSMPTGAISPAADDDGSGTAAVIEAARVLSHYNFAYTVVYALWDEEEYGLVGSNAYATAAETNGDSIVAVINVDAIAWDGDGDSLARVHVRDIANTLNLGTVAANMISTYGINLQTETNSPGATYSDHASFWNHDFSAILLIEDFDNDGNPHYHTTTDRVEFFDTTYFGEMAKWAFATTATMAVPVEANVSVSETEEVSFSIYPNPVNDVLTVRANNVENTTEIAVYAISGELMFSQEITKLPVQLDVSGLRSGGYLIRMVDKNNGLDKSQSFIKL